MGFCVIKILQQANIKHGENKEINLQHVAAKWLSNKTYNLYAAFINKYI